MTSRHKNERRKKATVIGGQHLAFGWVYYFIVFLPRPFQNINLFLHRGPQNWWPADAANITLIINYNNDDDWYRRLITQVSAPFILLPVSFLPQWKYRRRKILPLNQRTSFDFPVFSNFVLRNTLHGMLNNAAKNAFRGSILQNSAWWISGFFQF